jgi:glycosyltransferase involved in cell wall biosynthesis
MLSFFYPPSYSGSAVQAQNLSRHLLDLGIRPLIVSANLTGSMRTDRIDGVPVHRLPLLKPQDLQIPTFGASLAWFLWRNRRSIDIVHAHGAVPHGIAAPVSRLLGKKSILKITMANSDLAFQRHGRLWGRYNRYCALRFDRYVATSAEAYEECRDLGLDASRIELIANGVDTAYFRPARDEEERRSLRAVRGLSGGPLVCFVGVLDQRKNVDGILRVWNEVQRRSRTGHLLLIGPEPQASDGKPSPFAARLREYSTANGLDATITFAGSRTDVAECLRCADIFFFPSRREGMPNVLLEAMASGLACVASSIGGVVDLLQPGVSGQLFELGDEAGMATCLAGLLADPLRTRALGRAARERAEQKFSLRSTAGRYAELYRELLGRA